MAKRHEIAAIKLAIDIAADRGASTIWGSTAQQCLDEGQDFDPLTLSRGDEVERAHFLPASAKDCVALDLLSKLLNFVSFDRKKAEKDKARPTNLVALHALFRRKMVKDEVAFLPTYDQLLLLIPEVERLASDCIQPLYNDERWTMTVNLSKSAREYPLKQAQREEGDKEESGEGQESEGSLWAHAFEPFAFPRGQLRLHEYNDTADRGEVTHDAVPLEEAELDASSSSTDKRRWSKWDKEWPRTLSFVSPAIAILCWVNMVSRTGLPIPESMKAYWDLSTYLCRVAFISSGEMWAETVLFSRPDNKELPVLAEEVKKSATDLGDKKEHSRDLELPEEESSDIEACRGGQGDGGAKRKRTTDEGSSQKAKKHAGSSSSSSSDAASASSTSISTAQGKARAPSDPLQVSLPALQQDFDAATSRVTAAELLFFRELIKDLVIGGGDVPLYALVRGMEAVYELVGDARTQELKALLKEWQDAEDALEEVQVTLEWVADAQPGS